MLAAPRPLSIAVLDKHVLSYHWDGFEPHLIYYDRPSRKVDELPLHSLAWRVGDQRECVGRFADDGYRPCPSSRPVGRFDTCPACTSPWIPVQACVFEPQCDGDRCDHPEFCARTHYVYLASFGNLLKVGMTAATRLKERAIEQGADAVRPLFECHNRQEARNLEKETSRRFKVPQNIRAGGIARTLVAPPSRESIIHVHDHYLHRIARWREPLDKEIIFLDQYPLKGRPRSPPEVVPTEGEHRGTVLGIKGRYMLFRDLLSGHSRMLDLSDLPARSVRLLHPGP
jgi:hypothetical protein